VPLEDPAARVHFLRHHEEDDPGLVGRAFARRGYEVTVGMVDDDTEPVELDGVGVLGILGSKWSVYDDGAVGGWLKKELDAILEADGRGVAVLGICFGAQALCAAMGGSVVPAPALELGWVELEGAPAAGLPEGPWFEFHSDRCVVPDRAEVLAANAYGIQAFRLGRHLGVQFHPEIDAAQLSRWLEAGARDELRHHGVAESELLAATAAYEVDADARVDRLVEGFLARAG
jgi:GMP synthase-like glutamine amidotransferase